MLNASERCNSRFPLKEVEEDFVAPGATKKTSAATSGEPKLGRDLCEIKFATVVLAFPGYAHTAVFSEATDLASALKLDEFITITNCRVPCAATGGTAIPSRSAATGS